MALNKRVSIRFPGAALGRVVRRAQDSRWDLVISSLHFAHSRPAYGTQLHNHISAKRSLVLSTPSECKVFTIE